MGKKMSCKMIFTTWLSLGFAFSLYASEIMAWNQANVKTLQLVQIIMRHGDRNPVWTFPGAPHYSDPNYFPEGMGQVTRKGIKRTHDEGKFMRERYDGFLNRTYKRDEISGWSSAKDRAIISGDSFFRGLFPKQYTDEGANERNQIDINNFDDGEVSQIVPLKSVPANQDHFLNMRDDCPRFKYLMGKAFASEENKRFMLDSKDWVKSISDHTGLKNEFADTAVAVDYLMVQREQNKTLESWARPEMFTFMEKYIPWRFATAQTLETKRLRSSIVKHVVGNMNQKIGPKHNTKLKFVLFSGHDKTVVTFLNILEIYNFIMAPYGSSVLVELHKNPSFPDHHIEIYYRNDTGKEPFKLEMKHCPSPCFLAKFKAFTEPFFYDDYDQICMQGTASVFTSSLILTIIWPLMMSLGLFSG